MNPFFVIIIIVIIYVGLMFYLSHARNQKLISQGLMTPELKGKAFSSAVTGVQYMTVISNIDDIYNRLDKNALLSNKINPKVNAPAGMIHFETKLLVGATLRLISRNDDKTLYEFKILDDGKHGGGELACNIILTALGKVIG